MLCRRRDPSNAYSNGWPFGAPFDGPRRGLDLHRPGGAGQKAIVRESIEIDGGGRDTCPRQHILTRDSAATTHFNRDIWMRRQGIEPVSLDFRPAAGAVPGAEDVASPMGPAHPG